jgi:hypothetical protein
MTLTVCLVTRNEQANLPRVIGSVSSLADEVVVVDTGSSDATVQVATELGAKVSMHAWQDDFAAARNQALTQARSEWILWLNPDEELLAESAARVPELLSCAEVLGYLLHIQQLQCPAQTGGMETVDLRLYRRLPEICYRGRVHPHFEVPLDELGRRLNLEVVAADVTIRHHAYLSVLTTGKLRWAARLLEKELQDRPEQLHYLIEYGRTLLRLNDARGHKILAQAAEQLLTVQDAAHAPTPTVGSLLEYLLTVSAEQSTSPLSREQAQQLALRWFPHTPPVLWVLAQQAFQAEDYRGAANLLEHLVQLGRTGAYDHALAFEPAIIGDAALLNLGNCYLRLAEIDRAESCYAQLLASPSHHAQARQNYAYIQRIRGAGR